MKSDHTLFWLLKVEGCSGGAPSRQLFSMLHRVLLRCFTGTRQHSQRNTCQPFKLPILLEDGAVIFSRLSLWPLAELKPAVDGCFRSAASVWASLLHEPHSAQLLYVVCLLAAVSDQSGFCSSPVVGNGFYLHGNWPVWQFKHHNWTTWGASLCCWFCYTCSKMSVTLYLFLIDLFLYFVLIRYFVILFFSKILNICLKS